MKDARNGLWPRRTIQTCGVAVGVLVFGFVLLGVVAEAPTQWNAGAARFLSDAGLRLGFGALVALFSAAPYVLLAKAARQPGPPALFAYVGVFTLALQIWLSINALFLGQTSTAPIAMLFIPLYLGAMVATIWGATWIARRVQAYRGRP
jgi:hypothetical protein